MTPQHLPPFNKENLNLWFLQVEESMRSSKISGDTSKFDHVISRLSSDVALLIQNIIEIPHENNKYDTLKNKLLELFGKSEEIRVRQLLKTCRMGDENPLHFLQRMGSMVDRNVPDSVLKTIFLEQVPQSLYAVLAVNPEADLTTLALLADRVMEFRPNYIESMSRSNLAISWQPRTEDDTSIQHQLAEITRRITAMESNICKKIKEDLFKDDLDLNLVLGDLYQDIVHLQFEETDYVITITTSAHGHINVKHHVRGHQ
ncbi:hypothetical protein QLX08_004361 [Tetragonisca angustula]|uniref:DUF7041 domain-containing protein n=1 Tax=Tetragonisca angustula TaxID=166442 RepID=A0AAW1A363_9HYME